MQMSSQVLLLVMSAVLVCCVRSRSLPDYTSQLQNRIKRQIGDIIMQEKQAKNALGQYDTSCRDVGCGQVDPFGRGKRKRSDVEYIDSEEFDELRRLRLLQRVLDSFGGDIAS